MNCVSMLLTLHIESHQVESLSWITHSLNQSINHSLINDPCMIYCLVSLPYCKAEQHRPAPKELERMGFDPQNLLFPRDIENCFCWRFWEPFFIHALRPSSSPQSMHPFRRIFLIRADVSVKGQGIGAWVGRRLGVGCECGWSSSTLV